MHPWHRFKNDGSVVQTYQNINVHVVNIDMYMLRPNYTNVYG